MSGVWQTATSFEPILTATSSTVKGNVHKNFHKKLQLVTMYTEIWIKNTTKSGNISVVAKKSMGRLCSSFKLAYRFHCLPSASHAIWYTHLWAQWPKTGTLSQGCL